MSGLSVTDNKKIAIASDHGAYELKTKFVTRLTELGYEPIDMGVDDTASVDYPDYAIKVAGAVSRGEVPRGILLCGTGIGMSIAANKAANVRATLVHDHYTARMSREHNNSNILCIGGRVHGEDVAYDILETWLNTPYEGGRHDRRLDKISGFENGNGTS